MTGRTSSSTPRARRKIVNATPISAADAAAASMLSPRSGFSACERRLILIVIYAEIAINVINGAVSLFAPLATLSPLARVQLPAEAGEVGRWFGAITLTFGGWLLWRCLSTPAATRLVLEALCIGDVIYLASLVPFAVTYGQVPGIVAPYALTLVMFSARAYWLYKENWAAVVTSVPLSSAK